MENQDDILESNV